MYDDSVEVQRADPKLRLAALAIVVVALVLGAILLTGLRSWLGELTRLPASAARPQLLAAFAATFCMVCLAVVTLAVSLWRWGAGARRAKQWPLPGARVVRDTPILRGDAALRGGRLMQIAGVVLFLLAVCVAVLAWRLYETLGSAV